MAATANKTVSSFSVSRMATFCKNGKYAERIGAGTPIYVAAVLEYLTMEILLASKLQAQQTAKKRILPSHIMAAVQGDPELRKMLKNGTFCKAGYAPKFKEARSAARNGKKKSKDVDEDQDEDW